MWLSWQSAWLACRKPRVPSSAQYQLGMVAHPVMLALGKERREDQKLKVMLNYTVS